MTPNIVKFCARALTAVVLVGVIGAKPLARRAGSEKHSPKTGHGLIAHEWGTFTSIAGKDGVALEWRPLNGSSDLPGFVYDTSSLAAGTGLRSGQRCDKCNLEALVRMETPVIYFYADRETTVSVRVEFSKGRITEWYPKARLVYVPPENDTRNPASIDWGRITVVPGAEESFPVEAEPSHYYPARETDAAPLRVCTSTGQQHEKFLFYRGVGKFSPPLGARLDGGRAVVINTAREPVPHFIVFENRAGHIGFTFADSFDDEVVVDRPALDQKTDSVEDALMTMLVEQELYEKEARAMIKTWRDSWFEEGMRIFYIVPRTVTDSILPIAIEPRPSELTRVLVGRVEIITPEMEQEIKDSLTSLSDSSRRFEDIAAEITRRHGRFAEPVLKAIFQKTSEPSQRSRISRLINYARATAR